MSISNRLGPKAQGMIGRLARGAARAQSEAIAHLIGCARGGPKDLSERTGNKLRKLLLSYIREGVFTETMRNDALHVATAVVARQDVLVSWNFRHLVNRLRRARINEINLRHGYPTLEILTPPEV